MVDSKLSHLASCVDNVAIIFYAFEFDGLVESGLYCRIIRFDKVIFDVLDDK